MKHYKKLITISILILNILCLAQFAGGTGTYEDPYLIETAEQLNQVRNYMTSSFRQIADIDLGVPPWNEGTGWEPIGNYVWTDPSHSFRGNYDGNNYKIQNMHINNTDRSFQGVFGSTKGCSLKNMIIIDFDITTGQSWLGGLVGISNEDQFSNISVVGKIEGYNEIGLMTGSFFGSTIDNCHAKGEITSTGGGRVGGLLGFCSAISVTNSSAVVTIRSQSIFTGGFIGYILEIELIENCYSVAEIEVTGVNNVITGGFLGSALSGNRNIVIKNCYAEGNLYSDLDFDNYRIGGFAGCVSGSESKNTFFNIIDSYSKVNVTGNDQVGGFIGRLSDNVRVKDCYSTGSVTGNTNVGGFVGFVNVPETVTVTNSYWDMETAGIDSSAAGEGRTTAEMTYPYGSNTYIDWDFWVEWCRDTDNINDGYPYLRWSNPPDEGVVVQKHIPEQGMFFEEIRQLNISEVFADVNGNEVTVTVEDISDPAVLSADVSDSTYLILTAGLQYGKVKVYLKGTSGDHHALYEFKVSVYEPANYTIEDFETDGFLVLPWKFSGDMKWLLETDTVYEGSYSARSGEIDHDQNSEMRVEINYPTAGRISYFAKISSERFADYLKFFIDDELQEMISGEIDWQQYIFPVDAGENVFRWVYEKDFSISSGSDRAWVDYIVFEGGTPSGIEDYAALPVKHKLFQNYPNPFNPVTQIRYSLTADSHIRLTVYDISGREVAELFSGRQSKGSHSIAYNAEKLTSGIYFYSLSVEGNAVQTRKFLLLK